MRRAAALACASALLLSACGGDDDGGDEGPALTATTTTQPPPESTDPPEPEAAPLADVEITLTEVASLDAPTALTHRGGTETIYVAERPGRVIPLVDLEPGEPILDISDRVVTDAEQGLLGLAFSPDGGTLYVSYSLAPEGHTRVDAYTMDGDVADAASRRELLAVEQPFPNHNGGDIHIGPDDQLYIALGDGGSGGDPFGHGQDTQTLLGSILRIDPTQPSGGAEYAVP
jgi:glucose/arabinose dehydrogenase